MNVVEFGWVACIVYRAVLRYLDSHVYVVTVSNIRISIGLLQFTRRRRRGTKATNAINAANAQEG